MPPIPCHITTYLLSHHLIRAAALALAQQLGQAIVPLCIDCLPPTVLLALDNARMAARLEAGDKAGALEIAATPDALATLARVKEVFGDA